MSDPTIPQKEPYAVELQTGKTYYYCTCGNSASQPFCDGSHKDTEFTPEPFEAEKDGTAYLCGCKATGNRPFCDGTHKDM